MHGPCILRVATHMELDDEGRSTMFSRFEIETEAALRREEIARQVAAYRADEAVRNRATTRALRRYLATALRAVATRLAPTTAEPTADAEPLVT